MLIGAPLTVAFFGQTHGKMVSKLHQIGGAQINLPHFDWSPKSGEITRKLNNFSPLNLDFFGEIQCQWKLNPKV